MRVISQRQLWNTSTLQKHNTGEEKQLLQRKRKCPTRHDCLHGFLLTHTWEKPRTSRVGRPGRPGTGRAREHEVLLKSHGASATCPPSLAGPLFLALPPCWDVPSCPGTPTVPWMPPVMGSPDLRPQIHQGATLPVPTPAHSPDVPSGPKCRPGPC